MVSLIEERTALKAVGDGRKPIWHWLIFAKSETTLDGHGIWVGIVCACKQGDIKVWIAPIVSEEEKTTVQHDLIEGMELTRGKENTSNPGEKAGWGLCRTMQKKQGPMDPMVLEEHSNRDVKGLKPQHGGVNTFCRKTSEYVRDKERNIVGICLGCS